MSLKTYKSQMTKSAMQVSYHLIVLLVALHCYIHADLAQELAKCSSKSTCSSCIQESPNCAWCSDKKVGLTSLQRCDSHEHVLRKCAKSDIVHPQNSVVTLNVSSTQRRNLQLKPEFMALKIRPHSPQNITVTFQEVANYPVDLYYLMDLSYSMNDDKITLMNLGNQLGTTIGRITRDFKIGFGSFVDKKVSPFVEVLPNGLNNPCYRFGYCASPYGFINHMPLTNNISKFTQGIVLSRISGNRDTPEGTFDAMMQAIVCKTQIGWRPKARKILLVATDAGYHYAGDGKLGGIVVPNDGLCHLDEVGTYTKSTEQDYPSVSQMQKKVVENDINVIFAATRDVQSIYNDLTKIIKGSHRGTLASDSSNILDLVREQYKKISSTVELRDNSTNNVKVTYQSRCSFKYGTRKQTNICQGLSTETKVEFSVGIELISCPASRKERKQILEISPVGLSEKVLLQLEFLCDCDCEQGNHQEVVSEKCNRNGIWACGICKCDEGRFGEKCQCDKTAALSHADDTPCKMGNSTVVCSGRGQCTCGKCSCNKVNHENDRIYGTFCECNNFHCPESNGVLCGGNGECDCGQCNCYPKWQGMACECPSSEETCLGDPTEDVCSGQGTCDCGNCICSPPYGGKYCKENLTPGGKCIEYRKCAECFGSPEIPYADSSECSSCNTTFSVEVVSVLKELEQGEHKCAFKDVTGCNRYFSYTRIGSDAIPFLKIQKLKVCPEPVDLLMVVGGVIGTTLLIGIVLLLIWKIVTYIKDKREYENFKLECANVKWAKNENPLFRKPKQRFSNPMFGRLSNRISKRFSKFRAQ